MPDYNKIVSELRKIAFNDKSDILAYVKSCNLTIPQLKELYIQWYGGGGKCCLYGNKDCMINLLVQAIGGVSSSFVIIYGRGTNSGYTQMTNEQKVCYLEYRDNTERLSIESAIAYLSERGMLDEHSEKFVNYAL